MTQARLMMSKTKKMTKLKKDKCVAQIDAFLAHEI